LQFPGENAGELDVGDGLAVVFKIESHNHPSFVEPFKVLPLAILPTFVVPIVIVSHVLLFSWSRINRR
jgi:hypothetical protein